MQGQNLIVLIITSAVMVLISVGYLVKKNSNNLRKTVIFMIVIVVILTSGVFLGSVVYYNHVVSSRWASLDTKSVLQLETRLQSSFSIKTLAASVFIPNNTVHINMTIDENISDETFQIIVGLIKEDIDTHILNEVVSLLSEKNNEASIENQIKFSLHIDEKDTFKNAELSCVP